VARATVLGDIAECGTKCCQISSLIKRALGIGFELHKTRLEASLIFPDFWRG
jgi:hypothetical protein